MSGGSFTHSMQGPEWPTFVDMSLVSSPDLANHCGGHCVIYDLEFQQDHIIENSFSLHDAFWKHISNLDYNWAMERVKIQMIIYFIFNTPIFNIDQSLNCVHFNQYR